MNEYEKRIYGKKVAFKFKWNGAKVEEAVLLPWHYDLIVILSNHPKMNGGERDKFPQFPKYKYQWYMSQHGSLQQSIENECENFRLLKKLNHEE